MGCGCSSKVRNSLGNATSVSSQAFVSEQQDSQQGRRKQPRPMKPDGWWKEADDFLATDAWGADAKALGPAIWLQHTNEQMQFCTYQCRTVTVIMLIPANSSINGLDGLSLLRGRLREKGAQRIQSLEERLSKEWKGINAFHVPGYRYLCCDRASKTVKASPPSKVGTLSKESLGVLNLVRADVDLKRGRSERKVSHQDLDLEIIVRSKNNAWLVVRARGGQELYSVGAWK